jgi:hypothetical protein
MFSIFSDAYTDVSLTELPTVWSSTNFNATTVDVVANVWLLSNLDFLGMVTNYDTGGCLLWKKMHIDYYAFRRNKQLLVKIVNTVTVERPEGFRARFWFVAKY